MFPGSQDDFFLIPDEIVERVLVIGGGIAGLQAAQDVAEAGYEVVLIEREPSLGGRMAQLESMFPTLDHAVCALREKMLEVISHQNIKVLTYSEIESVSGFGGEFEAAIRKKARRVAENCNGCGICWRNCPAEASSEFDLGMGKRKAIYVPFAQAIPTIPIIDPATCIHESQGCEVCKQVCPLACIDFDQQDELVSEKFGAVIVATGIKPFDPSSLPALGFGRYPDVVSSVQLERLLSGAGPTRGEVLRPSDSKRPRSVLFVSCVGSRDASIGKPYCSRVCCSNIAKQAITLGKLYGDVTITVLYDVIQTISREGEDLIERARRDYNAEYVRGKISKIRQDGEKLIAAATDPWSGQEIELEADLIVLAVGIEASEGIERLAENLGIILDTHNFVTRLEPKLQPLETTVPGVYVAGAASGPLDITESLLQGSAAAVKTVSFLKKLQRQQALGTQI